MHPLEPALEGQQDMMALLERCRTLAQEISCCNIDDLVDSEMLFAPGAIEERDARWAFAH